MCVVQLAVERDFIVSWRLISTDNLIVNFKSFLYGGSSEKLNEGKKAKRKGL